MKFPTNTVRKTFMRMGRVFGYPPVAIAFRPGSGPVTEIIVVRRGLENWRWIAEASSDAFIERVKPEIERVLVAEVNA